MREEERAQAAQHVRAYLPDFRKAGVVLSFRGAKGRRVQFGKEKAAFLLTSAQVGRLTTDPEQGKPLAGFRVALVHHPLSENQTGL